MERVKWVIAVICLGLFVSNYQICELFYPNNLDKWWNLRHGLYAISFFFFCLLAVIGQKGHVRFVLLILMAFILGDIWDRLVMNNSNFVNSDYVLIGICLIITILYIKKNARQIRHKT